MATRSNALSELTRFWLEQRHGFFLRESVPVTVYGNQSDIDFMATKPDSLKADCLQVKLPSGLLIGPRVIIEAKDEHDWEPTGKEFGRCFAEDACKMGDEPYIPARTKGVKFTMLRWEHYDTAAKLFGSQEFDRLFVLHAIDISGFSDLKPLLLARRIHLLTVKELLEDLQVWYKDQDRPAGLRNSLVGDFFHLLFGFCKVSTRSEGE